MHDSVAAIRASRSRARFVLPQAPRRERHLGLHRPSRLRGPSSPGAIAAATRQPLRALRCAARAALLHPDALRAGARPVEALRRASPYWCRDHRADGRARSWRA